MFSSLITTLHYKGLSRLGRIYYTVVNVGLRTQMSECGRDVYLLGRQRITGLKNVRLGSNVGIAENSFMRCEGGLVIGNNTRISRNLVLYTINHRYEGERIPYDQHYVESPVIISRNVWIGMNVIILPGAKIGEGAIIGAGSVIRGTIPPLAIAVGNPAKAIRSRDERRYKTLRDSGNICGPSGLPYSRVNVRDPLADLDSYLQKVLTI